MERVLIKNLYFDEKIADMIEKKGFIFPPSLINCLVSLDTFPLDESKLTNILNNVNNLDAPISVVKSICNKYQVINGRHRICARILEQLDYIDINYQQE